MRAALWFNILGSLLLTLLVGCTLPERSYQPEATDDDLIAGLLDSSAGETLPPLEQMGYTIQVGAFAQLENAVRLERLLDAKGLDAYYFRHESGLYKVRFGNHRNEQNARQEATTLQSAGLIGEYYLVPPEVSAAARLQSRDPQGLRAELVRTARRFLGVPYRWGGTDQGDGFDCSGLTMVCYRLNGLNLSRTSRSQFQSGQRLGRGDLQAGDLVFFATNGGSVVSHVGLYIGDNRFIHAPRAGQEVRIEELSNYYARTFVGGRSYL